MSANLLSSNSTPWHSRRAKSMTDEPWHLPREFSVAHQLHTRPQAKIKKETKFFPVLATPFTLFSASRAHGSMFIRSLPSTSLFPKLSLFLPPSLNSKLVLTEVTLLELSDYIIKLQILKCSMGCSHVKVSAIEMYLINKWASHAPCLQ